MASSLPPLHVHQQTVKQNLFSKHDNRHAFQYSGVYFGQGLGKRCVLSSAKNQHSSENHLSWCEDTTSRDQPQQRRMSYCSTYNSGYNSHKEENAHDQRRRCSSAVVDLEAQRQHYCKHSTVRIKRELLDKFHTLSTKSNYRRFPRSHSLPDNFTVAKPSVNTTWWYSNSGTNRDKEKTHSHKNSSSTGVSSEQDKSQTTTENVVYSDIAHNHRVASADPQSVVERKSYSTPLSVLAAAQQPYLGHNPWTYSYKQ